MKNFSNKNAVLDNGVVTVLMFFVISLVFTATTVSWFLLQIYGVSVGGIALPSFTGGQYQNFVTDTTSTDVLEKGGSWNYNSGVGRIATQDESYLIFDNVASNNNYVYTNSYVINNSKKQDYGIILEYTSEGQLEIITKQDGFYYHCSKTFFGITTEDQFFAYPNANQLTDVTIDVAYNPTSTLDPGLIYKLNGQEVVKILPPQLTGVQAGLLKKYYGGVHAIHSGLTVKSFTSTNDRNSDTWSAFITQGTAFVSALIQLLVWNVDSQYLPWEINLIFIKTQLFAVMACAAVYIRG